MATVTDSATGITTTYYYDFTDRLMKYVESSSGSSHSVQYGYDDINNLTSLVETINGTAHTTSYAYDDDNRLTTVTNGSVSKTYGYDAYSRVSGRTTKYGTSTILTDTLTYMIPMSNQGTTGQVGSLRSQAAGYDVTYTYNYDGNGNLLYISDGTNITLYAYDSANQLIRENNQAANKTWVWTYDDGGNITSRTEYPYSTGGLGTATSTVNYTYDASWGDLLTGYNGQTISSDTIGNMLSDGTWTYTWEHGRELATMSNGTTTWTYTYNADGIRTSRSNGTTAYNYVYNGSSLSQMTVGSDTLYFAYDASTPMSVTYNGSTYYYVTNLQGDVTAILNTAGAPVVTYTYDAWGNILSANGTMAGSLGTLNPLRYRSYVYDHETGLYYLQSRYYDPELGRFINADVYTSTGQGLLGNNMFVYCLNNPVNFVDSEGTSAEALSWWMSTMWWLCGVDAVLPFGDFVYTAGIIVLGASILSAPRHSSAREDAENWETESAVSIATPPPNNNDDDDDDDDDDDYYDDDSNFGGRERVGKSKGNAPRNNQAQNAQFKAAADALGLNLKQRTMLHKAISGKGFGFSEIIAVAESLFNLRQSR